MKDENGQLVTGGIFYCRDSSGFNVSASNKLSCNLTGKRFEIGNKSVPQNPLAASVKDDPTTTNKRLRTIKK